MIKYLFYLIALYRNNRTTNRITSFIGRKNLNRSHFEVSEQLEASASTVWRLMTDTRTWTHWGPSVTAVDCPERYIRGGLAGRIRTPVGIWLPFTIERFDSGIYWDWQVAGILATGHRVVSKGPGLCLLTFTVPIWAVGYGVVCRVALNRIKRILFETLKEN